MFNIFKKTKTNGSQITYKISGMHCSSCSMNIDGTLEDLPGVLRSDTNYARSISKIEYDPSLINDAQIKKTITDLGYSVN